MFSKMPGGSNRIELNRLLINYLCYYDDEGRRTKLYDELVKTLNFSESKGWINKSVVLNDLNLIASYKSLRLSARYQSSGFIMGWVMSAASKQKIIDLVEFLESHDIWPVLKEVSIFSVIEFIETDLEPPPYCERHFNLVRMHFI